MLHPRDLIRQAAEAAADRVDAPASEVRGVILAETQQQTQMLDYQRRLLLWIIVPVLFEVAILLGGGAYISRLIIANQGAILTNQQTVLANQIVLKQMQAEGKVRGLHVLANQDTVKMRLAQLEAQR